QKPLFTAALPDRSLLVNLRPLQLQRNYAQVSRQDRAVCQAQPIENQAQRTALLQSPRAHRLQMPLKQRSLWQRDGAILVERAAEDRGERRAACRLRGG